MANADICVRSDVHKTLKDLRDTLGLKSFTELFQVLMKRYLDAPPGVPEYVFEQKRKQYLESFPDEFYETTKICMGVTNPVEFAAVFDETIIDLISDHATAPIESLVLQCSRCQHVWDYRGKHFEIRSIHCPTCGASASKRWLRELCPANTR